MHGSICACVTKTKDHKFVYFPLYLAKFIFEEKKTGSKIVTVHQASMSENQSFFAYSVCIIGKCNVYQRKTNQIGVTYWEL